MKTATIDTTKLAAFDELTLQLANARAVLIALQTAVESEDLAPDVLVGNLSAIKSLIERGQAAAQRLT